MRLFQVIRIILAPNIETNMTQIPRLKYLSATLTAISLAACSGGSDRYYDDSYYGAYDSYYNGNDVAYDVNYGADYSMMSANCMGPQGALQNGGMYNYSGAMTSDGLRQGGTSSSYSGKKSRYGSYEYAEFNSTMAGCTGGYWVVPTYQIIQKPAPTPEPVVTTTPSVTIQETCPDGQYRMDNGDCAIMITEETEQYVPPTIGYPSIEQAPIIDWYEPVRK